jgi:leader peptidase (prepilin peptidase)/N-methyltransferase
MPPEMFLFAPPATLAAAIVAAVFGLLIGSFLNVVVYRLPLMHKYAVANYIAEQEGKPHPHPEKFNLMVPRSSCPHCGHRIGALENIPVVSWLALRGKCKACRKPISARYPVVELVSGVLSFAAVWHLGSGWVGLASLAFVYLLLGMSLIDYDIKELPDDLTFPLLWIGLLVNLDGAIVPLRDAVIGAVAGYLFLYIVDRAYQLVRGQVGMGEGDFKLLAGLGAWFGFKMLPALVLMSAGVGAVLGITLIVLRVTKKGQYIPFGPYLAGAGMIALFYGTPVARAMQGFLP